jgi:hypothetical protein
MLMDLGQAVFEQEGLRVNGMVEGQFYELLIGEYLLQGGRTKGSIPKLSSICRKPPAWR